MKAGRTTNSGFPYLFYILAFGWTWAFWGPVALAENGYLALSPLVAAFLMDGSPAAWGPLIAAVIVAIKREGRAGLRGLLASMIRVRFKTRWYLVALLLLPAIVGGAQLIAWGLGEDVPMSEAFANPISIPFAFVWIFFLGGPLQEEAGWRGTATGPIQQRLGAVGASMVTGVFWGLWHLPLFYMPRADIYYNQPIWGLMISTVLLSVLLTWVYQNTGKSLFAVMLMHTTWNWSNYLFTTLQTDLGGLAFFGLMAGTIGFVVLRYGAKDLRR